MTQDTLRFLFGCVVGIVAIICAAVCIVVVVINERDGEK